ncbi:unnamed protein product [Phaeothamnion confervicola]
MASISDDDIDIFHYLRSLPADSLDCLYGGSSAQQQRASTEHAPWVCRAVVQSLPQLAKQYIMRLLCVEGGVSPTTVRSWVDESCTSVHRVALQELRRLRIVVDTPPPSDAEDSSREDRVCLNPPFREHLRAALCSRDSTPWRGRFPLKADKYPPDAARIEAEMHRKWQGVLHYLVGSDPEETGVPDPPQTVIDFMEKAQLMRMDESGQLVITNRGYEFMLKDIYDQAWLFVLTVVRLYEPDAARRDEILSFLLQLSCCKVGEDYPFQALTDTQDLLVRDFISLGLLFQRKAKSNRFYTTSAAVNLIFGTSGATAGPPGAGGGGGGGSGVIAPGGSGVAAAGAGTGAAEGVPGTGMPRNPGMGRMSILVETNYQVVAYTSSSLHLAMLSLFVELRVRMPNVVVGCVTRESVKKALVTGISARQILGFLRWHAHPNALKRSPVIPENVSDQIILWERERSRLRYDAGILLDISGPGRDTEFDRIVAAAEELGALVWASTPPKRLLVVAEHAFAELQARVGGVGW